MSGIYDNEDFFEAYSKMPRSKGGLEKAGEWYMLAGLFPVLKGKSVLDLGCGYGWHCKYAADNGASEVIGIDAGKSMIAEAVSRNAHPNISYRCMELENYDYPSEKFDLTISNLVLHYIEDLSKVYADVFKCLKPGGEFIFNIEHPVFTAGLNEDWIYDKDGKALYWAVDNYYYPGERSTVFLGHKVVKQHHTLTQILMGLIETGFSLEAVKEASPSPDSLSIPGMADEMRRPMMLLVKAKKK